MVKRLVAVLMAVVMSVSAGAGALAQEPADALSAAVDYLVTIQNDDGGFSNGFAPESDLGTTADVVVALVAAGEDPNELRSADGQTPLDRLSVQLEAGVAESAGQLAKIVTAVVAAGQDPRDFAGHNLVDELLALQDEEGVFGMGAFEHCLSLIALQNAGETRPAGAVEALVAAQNEDGGWGFVAGEASDTNTTGLCLQALALEDAPDAVEAALAYLAGIQNEDGGWPYQNPSDFGTTSDASSTALVIQALAALGEDLEAWNAPDAFLLSLQEPSGAFRYQSEVLGGNVLATVAAIPALALVPLNHWVPVPVAE